MSKAEEVRTYTTLLKDQEPLTIKQFLLDLEYGKDLVDSILSWDEEGDKDMDNSGNGVNMGDRDDAGTDDDITNKDNASW